MLQRCPQCGTDYDDDERLTFCPHDGLPLSYPQWLTDEIETKNREHAIRKHLKAVCVVDIVGWCARAAFFMLAGAAVAWLSLHAVDGLRSCLRLWWSIQ